MGEIKKTLILLIITLTLSIMVLAIPIQAQPTWSFRIHILQAELYMGEWGRIRVNITNMDCESRRDYILEFKSASEKYIGEVASRAEEMEKAQFIQDYKLDVEKQWGIGGEIWGDYTLSIYGACYGRAIEVTGAGLWFPFKGIARSMLFWNNTETMLEAFNPLNYILNGSDPSSTKTLEFNVYVPEDIPSEEISIKPAIDVRVKFPGWLEYTLQSYPIALNEVEIKPYRSFNITVTDFDGLNPIPNAKVVFRRLIYYYETREYITPENGTLKIIRLPDDKYEVTVFYNSSMYKQELPFIHHEQHWAYELASSKTIKTSLFNLKIKTHDLKNSPLNGSRIIFDGVEATAFNGEAVYRFVPQGNHSTQIFWRGVKVYDGWLWAGYHPTIYPWMTRPAVEHDLKLPVGDLTVKAVDTGGNLLPAVFTVDGPTPEASIENIPTPTGILNLSQLPITEYKVSATSIMEAFNKTVKASGVFKPGEESILTLPVHSVKIIVQDFHGKPLNGAYVSLGPVSGASSEDGSVTFSGVPEGSYEIEVRWLKIPVYSKKIQVSEPTLIEAKTNVYDILLEFVDKEGDKVFGDYVFIDPAGRMFRGEFKDGLKITHVPDGYSNLTIIDHDTGRILYNSLIQVYKLAEMDKLTLPIEDMVFKVESLVGKPIEEAKIIIVDLETGQRFERYTGVDGRAVLEKARHSNYKIIVYYPYTNIPVYSSETGFIGQEINVKVREAVVSVKVSDYLGNPVSGVEVSVYYMETPLTRGYTDNNGRVEFTVLEKPQYRIIVRHGSSQATAIAEPSKQVEVKLSEANMMGVRIDVGEVMSMFYTMLPIIIVIVCGVIVYKLTSRLVKSRWEE